MWMSGGSLMSEGGEARTFICDVCGERLPDDVVIEHYCVEGGEARNHEAEVERVPRAPHGIRQRDFRMGWEAALDAPFPERDTERLEELIRNLLCAWLNRWEPGENQDVIDEAERLLAEFSDASKKTRVSPDHDPGRTD